MKELLIFSPSHPNFAQINDYLSIEQVRKRFIPVNIDFKETHDIVSLSKNVKIDRFPSVVLVDEQSGNISKYDGLDNTISYLEQIRVQLERSTPPVTQQQPLTDTQQQSSDTQQQSSDTQQTTKISDLFNSNDNPIPPAEQLKKQREQQEIEIKQSLGQQNNLTNRGPI